MTQRFTLAEIFTAEELSKAATLFIGCVPGTFADKAAEQIIKPVIDRINEKTGQENDPKYLAYLIEYAITN